MTYTKCIACHLPFSAANVFTEAGARETQLSGLCEACFDNLFEEDGDCFDEEHFMDCGE